MSSSTSSLARSRASKKSALRLVHDVVPTDAVIEHLSVLGTTIAHLELELCKVGLIDEKTFSKLLSELRSTSTYLWLAANEGTVIR